VTLAAEAWMRRGCAGTPRLGAGALLAGGGCQGRTAEQAL